MLPNSLRNPPDAEGSKPRAPCSSPALAQFVSAAHDPAVVGPERALFLRTAVDPDGVCDVEVAAFGEDVRRPLPTEGVGNLPSRKVGGHEDRSEHKVRMLCYAPEQLVDIRVLLLSGTGRQIGRPNPGVARQGIQPPRRRPHACPRCPDRWPYPDLAESLRRHGSRCQRPARPVSPRR